MTKAAIFTLSPCRKAQSLAGLEPNKQPLWIKPTSTYTTALSTIDGIFSNSFILLYAQMLRYYFYMNREREVFLLCLASHPRAYRYSNVEIILVCKCDLSRVATAYECICINFPKLISICRSWLWIWLYWSTRIKWKYRYALKAGQAYYI